MSAPPAQERPVPAFVGPPSLVAAGVGTAGMLLPVLLGGLSALLLALPVLGLALLAVPVRTVRQVGTGLVASVLVWPCLLAGLVLLDAVGESITTAP